MNGFKAITKVNDMTKDIPAFPHEEKVKRLNSSGSGSEVVTVYHAGMTLRDYFAARAGEEDISYYREFKYGLPSCTREQAKYRYADAMLAAREVKHEHD